MDEVCRLDVTELVGASRSDQAFAVLPLLLNQIEPRMKVHLALNKVLTIAVLSLAAACNAVPAKEASPAKVQTRDMTLVEFALLQEGESSFGYTFEHHDARIATNTLRGCLDDLNVRVLSTGPAMIAVGSKEGVDQLRWLVTAFDSAETGPSYMAYRHEYENMDARVALNSGRSKSREGWVLLAPSETYIYAFVPKADREAIVEFLMALESSE